MNSGVNLEEDYRQKLLQGRSTLERSNQSIARSQAIAYETEQIGTEVIAELGGQRESLLRTKDRLSQTDCELDTAQRLMRTLKRRIFTNKFVLIMIILIEIFILISIVYIKFFKH